jgi:hypothetical protein
LAFFEKLMAMDRRWIFLLTWIFVLVPLTNPLGLPVVIGRDSTRWKQYIDDLPDGSVVLVSMDFGVSAMPELYPMTVATMHQLWQRDFKIVVVAFWNQGPLVFDTLLGEINPAESYGVVYGTDWVELGWIPGGETGMAALGNDIWAACPRDYLQKNDVSSFPIMQNIKKATDIDLIISIESGTPGLTEWLRQWNDPYGVKIIVGCTAVSVSGMIPFRDSGQLSALMPGLSACAEYEKLVGRAGLAIAGVDAISMTHLLLVLLVIVGNVAFFATRGRGKS